MNKIAAVLCLLWSVIASAKSFTLDDYIFQIQEANPTLQAAKVAAEKARFLVRPAATWEDPFIAAGVDEKSFDGSMGGVKRYQINQTIPFPGKVSTRSAIASYEADSARSDVETASRQVRILATQIFFKVFLNQKSIELNRELNRILKTIADSAKARYQSGTSGHHEWLRSQVEVNILEVEKLRLFREQKSLAAVFNEMRNQPVYSKIPELAFEYDGDPDIPSTVQPELTEQPELRSIDLFLKQVSEEEHLARLSYYPDLVLQGMMMEPESEMMGEKKNWGVMLGLNLPLFFWRKQSDLAQAASLQKRVAELERQSLLNRISAERLQAEEQLKTSQDVVKLYQTSVLPATRLAVQNAQTSYSARKLTLEQYLDALKVQRIQEIEVLAAQMDVHLAKLRLKNLLSNPPLLRLSPGRPSLFGGDVMGAGAMDTMESGAVNMGSGMRGPSQQKRSSEVPSGNGSGMEGM